MRSRGVSTRRTSRPGRASLPQEGPDAMRMRNRSTPDKPALLGSPEQYDERVATALVSSRRVEPHRIDALRGSDNGDTLAERLIAAGVVTDDDLAAALAGHYGVELLDFRNTDPQPEAVSLLPGDTARALRALPVTIDDDLVVVAVLDPSPEHVATVAAAIRRARIREGHTHQGLTPAPGNPDQ